MKHQPHHKLSASLNDFHGHEANPCPPLELTVVPLFSDNNCRRSWSSLRPAAVRNPKSRTLGENERLCDGVAMDLLHHVLVLGRPRRCFALHSPWNSLPTDTALPSVLVGALDCSFGVPCVRSCFQCCTRPLEHSLFQGHNVHLE
ncbi:hypothetical protein BHM03_00004395 [Ensete ventricosum]|nr:hypothetical protein BHM03_00004395 [Ensete ventricosum]